MIPKWYSVILIDHCLTQTSSKDFLQHQMRTDTEIHSQTLYRERVCKLEVSIKSLSSELRESRGRGGRKIVKVRGYRRHQENKTL